MAWETGNATSYTDLLNKLETFLTTHADLIADGEEWTLLRDDANGSFFEGPGLTGSESVYAIVTPYSISGGGNWALRAAQGYLGSGAASVMPGVNSVVPQLLLWTSTIKYWFIANGQRFIVIAKVGSVYQHAYVGKFLPYGTPTEYGLPLFVGGTTHDNTKIYSDTGGSHTAYWHPYVSSANSPAQLLKPDGVWTAFGNKSTGGSVVTDSVAAGIWPWYFNSTLNTYIRPSQNNEYGLFPATLFDRPNSQVYGELDGVYFVTGYNLASEDVITIDSQDYLVVQDTFRTGNDQFAAFKLL